MSKKIDTKTEGLDVYVYVAKTFADSPWLHYGLWEPGERATVPKLREAQERYVARLLALIPPPPRRVLDIGGGTGEMAKLLASRGYEVEMITPSPVQAEIARDKLGADKVHEVKFEDFEGTGRYDVCLFSESFQYVRLEDSLQKLKALLSPHGRVVIADCFRTDAYRKGRRQPGGGHRFSQFREQIAKYGFKIDQDTDVTEAAAQSMAIDQNFYREFASPAIEQIRGTLSAKRPVLYWFVRQAYRLFVPKSERENIVARLKADYRSPEAFMAVNTYRFLSLKRHNEEQG